MKSTVSLVKPLILASSVALAACGGGGGGGSSDTGTEISGKAEAPSGVVAKFENKPVIYALADFVFNPAYGAITGLQPVPGATVELIRIDNDGNQVGDVLATTATSITGDYNLKLPVGVDLSGDLVVRITGNANTTMSAQVVEQDIDINPISDFVLSKFVDSGADLNSLTTAAVVNLTGQVEEFDLTATADLSTMLAALEAETGDFVDANINTITSVAGDGASIAGDYVNMFFDLGLHDNDAQQSVGTFSIDLDVDQLTLSDAGNGSINVDFTSEEGSYTNQIFFPGAPFSVQLQNEAFLETSDFETGTASFSDDGVISGTREFEEEIDGDFGWRFPPSSLQFQKAKNANIFFGGYAEAGVRFETVDTDGDNIKDAIDPDAREGHEVFKGIEVLAKKPTAMTDADLVGTFGMVVLSQDLFNTGNSELIVDSFEATFNGAGSLDVSAATGHSLHRAYGSSVTYSTTSEMADTGIPITTSASGEIQNIGGTVPDDNVDGYVNESFDFMAWVFTENTDDSVTTDNLYASTTAEFTYGVKLPTAQIDINNRTYRLISLSTALTTTETELIALGFESKIVVDGSGAATATFENRAIFKSTIFSDVESESDDETGVALTSLTVDASGNLVLSLIEGTDEFHGEGYMSHDGSIGILQVRNFDTGQDPDEIGILFLIEIDS